MGPAAPELVEALVRTSPSGLLITDEDGCIQHVNPALRAMVPVVPDAVGRAPIEAVPVQDLAAALEAPGEVRRTLSHGNRDLSVHVVPLGEGLARLAVVQDLTGVRRGTRLRNEFVANVSHELRTPATAISGYAETLLEDADQLDDEVVSMVEVIARNARRLTDLFDDLLVLARLDAREGPLPLHPVRLSSVVAEALDKARALADQRRITFEVLVPRGMRVLANRDAMGHVVGNLVHNAVKYSFEDGIVTVRAQFRRGFVLLEVIDVGIGIDPAWHDRVFERFVRVDKGRSRAAGGTGLGLSIVKTLVEKMGAAVEVRSRPGKGSVFRVLLRPAAEDGATDEDPTEQIR